MPQVVIVAYYLLSQDCLIHSWVHIVKEKSCWCSFHGNIPNGVSIVSQPARSKDMPIIGILSAIYFFVLVVPLK